MNIKIVIIDQVLHSTSVFKMPMQKLHRHKKNAPETHLTHP